MFRIARDNCFVEVAREMFFRVPDRPRRLEGFFF